MSAPIIFPKSPVFLFVAFNAAFPLSIQQQTTPHFSEADISLVEAFAIFCGIGIHNTKMYEGVCRLMAKQKVRGQT